MTIEEEELELLRAVAREASDLVMAIYATDFSVEMKGVDDPVTRADREANELICARLAERFPHHGILAEESAPNEGERALLAAKERLFFVDPVDGTREFADKNGQFCVMIGVVADDAFGVPRAVAGVVAVPTEDVLYWGSAEGGSFAEPIAGGAARRLHVAARSKLRAVVSRSHASPKTQAILAHLGVAETIPCGSVGLKAARVVDSRAELYVHPSRGAKLWDACAPDALMRGAGGLLTGLDGEPIRYRGPLPIDDGIIATSHELLPRVLAAIDATSKA